MQTREIGKNGIKTSALGVGAMSFAGVYGNATEEQSHVILDMAMERGVTHIDTSNAYGNGRSETIIGNFLKMRGAAARDHFSIATKASIAADPDTGKRYIDNRPEHLASELEKSLKRLDIECVDLFYLHRYHPAIPIEDTVGALGDLVKAGKARAIGLSEIAPSTLRRAAAVHPIAAVQSEYSLATRAPELGLVQACDELGASLVAFSSVGRGTLSDSPHDKASIEASPFLSVNARFLEPNYAYNLKLTEPFRKLAADMGMATASLAIAWVLAKGDHIMSIPGTRNPDHFTELADGAERRLTGEEVAAVEKVLPVGWCHGDRYNTAQWIGPERYC